jgi:hypothetical protein
VTEETWLCHGNQSDVGELGLLAMAGFEPCQWMYWYAGEHQFIFGILCSIVVVHILICSMTLVVWSILWPARPACVYGLGYQRECHSVLHFGKLDGKSQQLSF